MKKGGWKMGFELLFTLGALAAMPACYEHTYTIGSGAPGAPVVYDQWRHHWIGGLISPDHEQELQDECPSGNATIHQEVTFLNGLVSALTSGIYSPTTVTIRCEDGRRADLDLDSDDVARIVADPNFLEWVEAVSSDLVEEAEQAQELLDP